MELSDAALRTVRAALLEYRSATRVNGRKRAWFAIADDMHRGFLEDDETSEADPRKALAEALRRFAAATQTPAPERLDALSRFLIHLKFLYAADIEATVQEPILVRALQDYFGLDGEAGETGPPLSATFAGRRKVGTRTELSLLTIGEEQAGTFAVTENLYSLPIAPTSTKRDALTRILSRIGGSERRYSGWLVRTRGQHCLFARDEVSRETTIDIILIYQTDVPGRAPADITLVKSRDFGFAPAGYAKEKMKVLTSNHDPEEGRIARIKDNIWHYTKEQDGDGA
ncbi:hypothetical protein CN213_06075 [Sinorhizobium meliloti]|uniref:hypothetical protein n=1 Tax=Rhizobium meliloti TaxID=382 RepID=UPI000FD7379F|nr:hypothetical protein [Sinorhizobium meliloti]RVH60070.1 hypothetical protein CN213_06075 [Sinorhizobium meliloti]